MTQQLPVKMNQSVQNGHNLKALLDSYQDAFTSIASNSIDVNRLLRIALTSVSRNSKLLECSASSVVGSLMMAAQLGLEPGLEAHLVPYKSKQAGGVRECQLIPDYRGLIKLVRRSGEVSAIRSNVVFSQDAFYFMDGLRQHLEHKPEPNHAFDSKDIIAAYAVCEFSSGATQVSVMYRVEIDKIMRRSRAHSSGPWVTDYAEMAKKTVIRRICKLLPSTPETHTAVALDTLASEGISQKISIDAEAGNASMVELDEQASREQAAVEDEVAGGFISSLEASKLLSVAKASGFSDAEYSAALRKQLTVAGGSIELIPKGLFNKALSLAEGGLDE